MVQKTVGFPSVPFASGFQGGRAAVIFVALMVNNIA